MVAFVSLISDMHSRSSIKALIHDITAAGMWAGFWLILISGLMALVPVIINVESLPIGGLSYLLEISSSVFLDFVIAGVVIYILCAIPWQATTAK